MMACEIWMVKIAVMLAHDNTVGVVLRMLQCLKDQMGEADANLMMMSTSDGRGGFLGMFDIAAQSNMLFLAYAYVMGTLVDFFDLEIIENFLCYFLLSI